MVALGAGDSVGPVALAGAMLVAGATHLDNGPFTAKSGFELPLTNFATALALWMAGPGSISFDRLTGFTLPSPARRVIVTGAVASSAVSLAMVLRARRGAAVDGETEPADRSDDQQGGLSPDSQSQVRRGEWWKSSSFRIRRRPLRALASAPALWRLERVTYVTTFLRLAQQLHTFALGEQTDEIRVLHDG